MNYQSPIIIYAAEWILPVSSAPIKKGALAIGGAQIIAVGTQDEINKSFPQALVKDFGEVAILPGFVNSHAHLELTAMRGLLDSVEHNFFEWLRNLTAARNAFSPADLSNSILCGAAEAARAGVTCIGDIATDGRLSAQAMQTIGLRGITFQEIINPDARLADETAARLKEQIAVLREYEHGAVKIGVSPHAPYSVSLKLFEYITDFALAENLAVSIHAAESRAEVDFIKAGTGIFYEFLRGRGIVWNAPKSSTIKYLEKIGVLAAKPLLAHCVNVDARDLEIIALNEAKIAHCPKSNAKFAHGIAPFAEMLAKNITVGLGSDSVASNNVCDILEEARIAALLQRTRSEFISAEQVLFAATLGGAAALGLERETGSLETGKQADFCVISLAALPQQPITDVYAAIVFASLARDVVNTTVNGQTVYENDKVTAVDESAIIARLKETARKITK